MCPCSHLYFGGAALLSLGRLAHNSRIVEVSSVLVGACGGQPQQPSPITGTARRADRMSGAHHHDLGSGPQSLGARLQIQSDRSNQPRPHHNLQNAWLLTLELAAQPVRRARQARRGRQGGQRLIAVYGGLCRHCHYLMRAHAGVGVASRRAAYSALCCCCRGGHLPRFHEL